MEEERRKPVEDISKRYYKLTLQYLKVIPMLLAFCDLLNTALYLIGINAGFLSYIGGVSFLTLAFLYLVSYVFKFCIYHRMFLHYIALNDIIGTIEYTIGIPVSDNLLIGGWCTFTGVFLFLILYFYRREKCCK